MFIESLVVQRYEVFNVTLRTKSLFLTPATSASRSASDMPHVECGTFVLCWLSLLSLFVIQVSILELSRFTTKVKEVQGSNKWDMAKYPKLYRYLKREKSRLITCWKEVEEFILLSEFHSKICHNKQHSVQLGKKLIHNCLSATDSPYFSNLVHHPRKTMFLKTVSLHLCTNTSGNDKWICYFVDSL